MRVIEKVRKEIARNATVRVQAKRGANFAREMRQAWAEAIANTPVVAVDFQYSSPLILPQTPIIISEAAKTANATANPGRVRALRLSNRAPAASAQMLAAEIVTVVRITRPSKSPNFPLRIATIPKAALSATETIKNQRAIFLGDIVWQYRKLVGYDANKPDVRLVS